MHYLKHILIKFYWSLFNKHKYLNYLTRYDIQKSFNKALICDTLNSIKRDYKDERQTQIIYLDKCRPKSSRNTFNIQRHF